MKMNKNGKEYPIGVIPQNYIRKVDELEDAVDNLKKYQYTRKASNSFTSTDPINFTAPTDGYLCIYSSNPNTEVFVILNGTDGNSVIVKNGIIAQSSSNWKFDTLYMRKNMMVTITPSGGTNGGYQFFGF
jgi:hypothetical protein